MSVVGKLRQPQYTGDNRCMPCTLVNLVIALFVAGLVLIGASQVAELRLALVSSIIVLIGLLVAIWFRGYVVPGTPSLTKRYMPSWMLSWFGKERTPNKMTDENVEIDAADLLVDNGILYPCSEIDDLCLDESFSEQWMDRLENLPTNIDTDEVLDHLGFNQSDIEREGDGVVLIQHGRQIGHWPSETAFKADIASAQLLSNQISDWNSFNPPTKSHILYSLRIFLAECPNGEPTKFKEETVESCCSTHDVVTMICSESEERILEQRVDA